MSQRARPLSAIAEPWFPSRISFVRRIAFHEIPRAPRKSQRKPLISPGLPTGTLRDLRNRRRGIGKPRYFHLSSVRGDWRDEPAIGCQPSERGALHAGPALRKLARAIPPLTASAV